MLQDKFYVWGFPGIGKSSLSSTGDLKMLDADCELFKYEFLDGQPSFLHKSGEWENVYPSANYPQNYFDFISSAQADVVFINCHLSLLERLDKDLVLMVYPSRSLKDEYLERYARRGDNASYLSYMNEIFDELITLIEGSPIRKYCITQPNTFLQDLIDGGNLMSQLITKNELVKLLEESIQFGVFTPAAEFSQKNAGELAQLMFDGDISLDLDVLRKDLAQAKALAEKERLMSERRGGLTHDELKDKILQGIVNGTLTIHHAEIAPYSHGYEVMFVPDGHYTNRWECYCPLSEVADTVVRKIENGRNDTAVFDRNVEDPWDISAIIESITENEKFKLTHFVEESKAGLERRGRYTGHVANLSDVHNGRALDGIIQGHFLGDYSSITTVRQNELMKALVVMKGFCLDCIDRLPRDERAVALDYLKMHGPDISTPKKLQAWIDANPDKCGLSTNRARKVSLDQQIQSASAKTTDTKLVADKEQER